MKEVQKEAIKKAIHELKLLLDPPERQIDSLYEKIVEVFELLHAIETQFSVRKP